MTRLLQPRSDLGRTQPHIALQLIESLLSPTFTKQEGAELDGKFEAAALWVSQAVARGSRTSWDSVLVLQALGPINTNTTSYNNHFSIKGVQVPLNSNNKHRAFHLPCGGR